MKKRKADDDSGGVVSAFAFKAKQVPLQDLSNSKPSNETAVQLTNNYNGTNGHAAKKTKLAVATFQRETIGRSPKHSTSFIHPSQLSNGQQSIQTLKEPWNLKLTRPGTVHSDDSGSNEVVVELEQENSSNSGTDSPRVLPSRQLSTFKPTPKNVISDTRDGMLLRMRQGDTLAILGQYDLWVLKGAVNLMGVTLHPSSTAHRVYAPSTHSLPAIRCVPDPFSPTAQQTEIEILPYKSGLRLLRQLSPRFGRIWNDKRTSTEGTTTAAEKKRRSFSPMYTSAQDPRKRPLRLLEISSPWGSLVNKLSSTDSNRLPIIMVCGPKSSGKSTFSRHTLNYMLSKAAQRQRQSKGIIRDDGVALLDLDPGQPEFSPPGELSLVHLHSPVFGPPFTHPIVGSMSGNHLVRAHHVAAISPKDDPDHYVACALDLKGQYRRLLHSHPTCPLVINCSGWILGSGLEILTELIHKLGVSDVVYMSDTGPAEVVDELIDATGKAQKPFYRLPSQPLEFMTRSAADLRAMQSLSYFHTKETKEAHLKWDDTPITNMAPWIVRYAGSYQGICGIMVLGERQDPDFLAQLLDGSLVGVVAIEDYSAIPGQHQHHISREEDLESPETQSDGSETLRCEKGAIYQYRDLASNGYHFEDENPSTRLLLPPASSIKGLDYDETEQRLALQESDEDHPSILRTVNEDLPYLFSGQGTCMPLDPAKSHSLGLALIRGIDKKSKTLHLVSPIPETTIRSLQENKTKIVLVRGKLDTPSWAYQEEYCAAAAAEKRQDQGEEGELLEERGKPRLWEGDVPWVRLLQGQEGKGRGEKVWRVRRNLMSRDPHSDGGLSD
ncbi:MAG: Polynucleotide 5'-hydroxyl-kinase grc3 [Pleopsidium flavum]|nr:MAG: Polynucleotide 5'-hydroxyl-kinase grc3 [Pleopsidium flavum]